MFDIGFSEMLVIGVVALIVIGPEKLPRVARTVGHLFGRLQRYVADVKADINREIELEELRKMRDSMQKAASEYADRGARAELSKTAPMSSKRRPRSARLPRAADKPAKPPEQPSTRESDQESFISHLIELRAAADARGRRGAGAVRRAVHLARARATSTTCSPRR